MKFNITILLAEIKQERQSRRRAVPMQPPASHEQLQKLASRASEELNYRFPATYLEMLSVADGIDSNGILLYASETQLLAGNTARPDYIIEGVVEANLLWRDYESNQKYVFYGEAGDMVYCHNLTTDKFQIMDRISQDVDSEFDVFGTCEELFEKILNHMLDRYDVAEEEA